MNTAADAYERAVLVAKLTAMLPDVAAVAVVLGIVVLFLGAM